MSPVFHREKEYVFKVFSNEEERMHLHIIKAESEAKFWLEPQVELAENYGFSSKELATIQSIIENDTDGFKHKYAVHIGKRLND